ncbi:rhamnogalacturonyl hydrolase YesR [Sphingomonas naasensis]|uniref:Glycoside hydrolase family 88 protein n=1 Tax=Sphingomonas naasensis TaxID=1344951 RepID=A0A4S1WU14_9SPHN|nr:glycoside hydrolase family 88 protein [Sphingomonas naasensis]NIJ19034.1 rhamnogalacturonyl hydrolase YesR [Sphingomonas naasensis]TGX46235.1 glycoside hydrolase family 88 protein [Sphingomonas naasensis]
MAAIPGAQAQLSAPAGGMHRDAVTDVADAPTRLKPAYPAPYGRPSEAEVKAVLDRVLGYIDRETPTALVDAADREQPRSGPLAPGARLRSAYRLTSYEWGVTYSGALLAGAVTGDARYTRYVADRLGTVVDLANRYREQRTPGEQTPVRQMLAPGRLDDSGAMAAALIKAQRANIVTAGRGQIDVYLDWISNHQYRLSDGTLAREVPMHNSLWLDDLYMSVPALAQMGALTGERRYFDDAVRQILQFSGRMFVKEAGLYRHGWVDGMDPHPSFFWGRANGWAIMATVELLEVLPADHPGRPAILDLLRAHAAGLARLQSGTGLWHQLLDRPDSYLETSATAIYAYSIARAINRGWLDRRAYAPVAVLAWNAVTTKVNAAGEVEDVCVGTGMGFDPAFYYFRPRHVRAAHGYGPVLLAGAEIIALLRKDPGGPRGSLLFR